MEQSGLSEEEVKNKIKEKQEEFSNLISEEGAAYIIAKELGVELREEKETKIRDIKPNTDVDVLGKVIKENKRVFDTEKAKGVVQKIIIADETGVATLSLWNREIEKYDVKPGDVLRIRGFAKEGPFGVEIKVGNYGLVEKH